jgi:hypothetical protein
MKRIDTMKEVIIGLSLAALAAIVVPAMAAHTSAPLPVEAVAQR